MTTDEGRKHSPPYVSYKTFDGFMTKLQQHLPTRIDRSYWGEMFSGSTGTQLMSAMRFLNLVDANARPMPRLKLLVSATTGEHRAVLLRQVADEAYAFALKGTLDTQNATYAELEDVFKNTYRMKSDVCRKCIKFFTEFAKDAGIPLSPQITKKRKMPRTSSGVKNTTKTIGTRTNENFAVPFNGNKIPELLPWHQMLADKFPHFDPTWNDELKKKWFEAYFELFKINPHRSE
jgi:hypothetical protein